MFGRLGLAAMMLMGGMTLAIAASTDKGTPNAAGAGGTAGVSMRDPAPRVIAPAEYYRYESRGGKATQNAPGAGGTSSTDEH